jgi:hypothetical protein
LPIFGNAALPDRLLLGLAVALLRRRDDGRIDQLPGHGEVALCPELLVEQGEQLYRTAAVRPPTGRPVASVTSQRRISWWRRSALMRFW